MNAGTRSLPWPSRVAATVLDDVASDTPRQYARVPRHHPIRGATFIESPYGKGCGRRGGPTTEKYFVLLPHAVFHAHRLGAAYNGAEPLPELRRGLPGRSRGRDISLAEQHLSSSPAAPARPRPSFRHRLEYLAVVSVVAVVRVFPVRAVLAAGTVLGRAFYLFDRGHRRLALKNLRAALPVRTEAECRWIAREMFSHFGRLLAVLLNSVHAPEKISRAWSSRARSASSTRTCEGACALPGAFGSGRSRLCTR